MTGRVADVAADALTSPDRFRAEVVAACRPVVLRGAVRDWPVRAAAEQGDLAAYLARLDAGRPAEVFVGAPAIAGRYTYSDDLSGFNFERRTMRFGEALAEIVATAGVAEAPTMYVGSLSTEGYLPGFAAENGLAFLPTVQPRIWLGHRSSVACHYDTSDNIACVVAGMRRFTLYPPEAIGGLYVGPIDHTMAGQPVALAVGSTPGDPRYPRFKAIRDTALVVDLEPGDALYIPKLWWHQVEATGGLNVLVNYWWDASSSGPDQPHSAMMLAMVAIADRPAGERAAWRAFFDHYVFRPDGHPLAHLPAERHGILGAGNSGRIRAMVMRLLRGV
ncbi:cupin-like domain-containing protein [Sphingomonas arantia]|uniref:Cupin-like domain-containing protein n=1 Tax=Sphingomonas arantia TaxID=1460676 RepID=A0ABW4U194_9SPHN